MGKCRMVNVAMGIRSMGICRLTLQSGARGDVFLYSRRCCQLISPLVLSLMSSWKHRVAFSILEWQYFS